MSTTLSFIAPYIDTKTSQKNKSKENDRDQDSVKKKDREKLKYGPQDKATPWRQTDK